MLKMNDKKALVIAIMCYLVLGASHFALPLKAHAASSDSPIILAMNTEAEEGSSSSSGAGKEEGSEDGEEGDEGEEDAGE